MTTSAPQLSAGARLRHTLDLALASAAREQHVAALEFDELEQRLIDQAVELADFAERVRAVRDAELAGDCRPSSLVNLSAEYRHLLARVDDIVGKLKFHPPQSAVARPRRRGRPGIA
ncbi:hypothetical protein ACPCIR_16770 [Mycobacterium sp. NPDC051198]